MPTTGWGQHLLRRAMAALDAAPVSTGWIYGDFDLFGTPGNWSSAGPYSLLQHLAENICDAGALVRREVFEAGVAFSETLRSGFEDWDFWLAAAGRGFRGEHLPGGGLAYRRRPESLLKEARRRGAYLLGDLRARHGHLYAPRALLGLEATEAPRYALFESEGAAMLLDPADEVPHEPTDDILRHLAEAARSPGGCHAPAVSAFAAPGAMDALRSAGIVRGLFALAEGVLADTPVCTIRLATEQARLAIRPASEPALADAALVLVDSRAFGSPLAEAASPFARLPARGLCVGLPITDAPAAGALALAASLAPRLAALSLPRLRTWRQDGRIARSAAAGAVARDALMAGPLLPLAPRADRRDIGLVVPGFGLGGVERVLCCLATELARHGWRAHLFVTGQESIAPPPDGAFDSVTLLPGMHVERHGGDATAYFGAGTAVLADEEPAQAATLLGLLAPMNAVLVTHAFAGHALAGRLRGMGVRTLCGLHLSERGAFGEPNGTPHIALAYEHAYDIFAVHSERLAGWSAAAGIPSEKIVVVPNAPGYEADPALVAAAAQRPARGPRPLRALVLGRLDHQKGPDRLPAIMAATAGQMEWRVVGRAELDRAAPALPVEVEPPVATPVALDALYAWADVLVLPSRFEGVPLTVLEAQRLGCVPVATAVGGLPEAVEHGRDGLLVPPGDDAAVADGVASALLRLVADDGLRLYALARRGGARRGAGVGLRRVGADCRAGTGLT